MVGWNRYCKDLYAKAREDFLSWHRNGRVRFGNCFLSMKRSRSEFKKALRFCRTNELRIRKEILLDKFAFRNKQVFWKELRNSKGNNNLFGNYYGISSLGNKSKEHSFPF